jgi:hypothetical protein
MSSKAQGCEPPNDEVKPLGAAYLVIHWHIPENLNLCDYTSVKNHKTCKCILVWLMGFSVTAMCAVSVYFTLCLPLSTVQQCDCPSEFYNLSQTHTGRLWTFSLILKF